MVQYNLLLQKIIPNSFCVVLLSNDYIAKQHSHYDDV